MFNLCLILLNEYVLDLLTDYQNHNQVKILLISYKSYNFIVDFAYNRLVIFF